MGVFEFILLIVLITTIGKVLAARGDRARKAALPSASQDLQNIEEMLGDMGARLTRLEEERDFYRALLDPPAEERVGPSDRSAARPEAGERGDP